MLRQAEEACTIAHRFPSLRPETVYLDTFSNIARNYIVIANLRAEHSSWLEAPPLVGTVRSSMGEVLLGAFRRADCAVRCELWASGSVGDLYAGAAILLHVMSFEPDQRFMSGGL